MVVQAPAIQFEDFVIWCYEKVVLADDRTEGAISDRTRGKERKILQDGG